MREVELKVRNINKQEIIDTITQLGAVRIFGGKVIDFRFDTPDRDLSRQGKALRIRQKGSHVYLNLKGKKKSKESIIGRDEIGVKISNFRTMQNILHELGYIKIFELIKYRTQYRYKDITFDIDEYAGLDPILEIESDSYEKVREYIDILGIQEEDIGRVYIREILEAKRTISTKEFLDSKYKKNSHYHNLNNNKSDKLPHKEFTNSKNQKDVRDKL
ncbi:MAG: class IV adenylate cyclase [Candidatus Nanoarchaeia archaeon]